LKFHNKIMHNKIITVIGLGESGFSAAKLLHRTGVKVRVSDCRATEEIKARTRKLRKLGIKDIEIGGHTKNIITKSSLLVVSPGIRKDNKLVKLAKERNISIIGEIELGSLYCRAPIIALTGTNGKTTTATLIYKILKKAGKSSILCGNIGRPFCDYAEQASDQDVIVLEVSSFQLAYTDKFKPKVSIILNAESDHLDYHKNLREYYRAKSRIYQNQDGKDFCILRKKDYQGIFSNWPPKSNLRLISNEERAHFYLDNQGNFIKVQDKREDKIIKASEIKLDGIKSLENVLAVLAVADIYKINNQLVTEAINSFKGLRHRIEPIGVFGGIKYINDSKATNIAATTTALENIKEPVILLAGGIYKDKEISGVNLGFLKNTKEIILFGQSKNLLAKAFNKIKPTQTVKDLAEAVRLTRKKALRGDCVLLSPMCSSFDQFRDYRDRGRVFREEVLRINK
jgi:UDP-N-acetylmuramoylalanine--D-glutamate ligase